jgi:hypothetical protein
MQFGNALPRLLERLVYCNTCYGPPLMSKIDLADGYYRVPLSADAALSLAVLIPSDTRDTAPLEAFPLVLPMGWAHSPPYFCAFTETIADITNSALRTSIPSHPLLPNTQCTTKATAPQFHPTAIILGSDDTPPLQYSDVYIEDFMLLAQKPHHMPLMHNLLTAIDMVFKIQSIAIIGRLSRPPSFSKVMQCFQHSRDYWVGMSIPTL